MSHTVENFEDDDDKKHIDFDLNLKILHYLGVLPPQDVHGLGVSKLYRNYTIFGISLLASCVITQLIDIYVCWGDFDGLTTNVCSMLSFAVCMYKFMKTVEMRKVIHDLLERLDRIFIVYIAQSGDSEHILDESEWHARAVTVGFLGLGGIAVVLGCFLRPLQYLSDAIVHSHEESDESQGCHNRNLPLIAWLPFNTTISPYYELAYAYHTIASVYSYLVSASMDVFYVSIIIHVCGELKLLQFSLLHVSDRATKIAKEKEKTQINLPLPLLLNVISNDNELTEESIAEQLRISNIAPLPATPPRSADATIKIIDGEATLHRRGRVWEFLVTKGLTKTEDILMNAEMYRSLIRCIEHHQELLRFTEDLEDAMNYVMIVQFIGSIIIICMALVQVTVTANGTGQVIKNVFNLVSMTVQILLYCWYGQDLIEQSTGVHIAAYNSAWLDATEMYKTSIRFIIARAQKPLLLTAGKFYVISLHSFLVILEASLSLFAVLRQIN